MDYTILSLSHHPDLRDTAARWFHEKWGVPLEAYLESMDEAIAMAAPYPRWYLAMEGERIVGGLGVIENDFHARRDLAPNVCAVYTEEDRRGRGIAGALLNHACAEMKAAGIDTLYLLTNHVGFYERYSWEFFTLSLGDYDETPSRLYIHRA